MSTTKGATVSHVGTRKGHAERCLPRNPEHRVHLTYARKYCVRLREAGSVVQRADAMTESMLRPRAGDNECAALDRRDNFRGDAVLLD